MTLPNEGMGSMGPNAPQGPAPGSPAPGAMPYASPGYVGPGGPGMPYGPPPAGWDPRPAAPRNHKSPWFAGLLSFLFPGLGQIYLGYYQRGFAHAGIFVMFIGALTSIHGGPTPMFGVGLGFFYMYNVVDAVRRASLYNQAMAGLQPTALPEDFKLPEGRASLLGGAIIVVVGLMLLFHTRFDFDLNWLEDWWPAFIVLIGANIVYRAVRKK